MMTTLELPEPAAELWTRTARTLRKHIAEMTGSADGFRLGGGTILAAQWKHRLSFDIDITVDERTPLEQFDSADCSFRKDLERLGGSPSFESELGSWTVDFGNGRLEVWAKNPLLDGGERRLLIQGIETTVLSNAQILRGKLERAELNLPRDAFDVWWAQQSDPTSLEWAVNALPARQALTRTGSWKLNNAYIAAMAPEVLAGIAEADRRQLGTLGSRASETAWNAVYERLAIRVEDRRVTVTAVRRDGQEREGTYDADDVVEQCRRRGLGRRLEASTGRGIEILDHAAALARSGGTRRAVYEEAGGTATAWETADSGRGRTVGPASRSAQTPE